jgi:enoyl-CoA hydratase/carnithine racemase
MDALGEALDGFEAEENIGCVVLTGSEKVFAAGADISAIRAMGYKMPIKPISLPETGNVSRVFASR